VLGQVASATLIHRRLRSLGHLGYHNAYVGKWHCGHDRLPLDYGIEGWSLPDYGRVYMSDACRRLTVVLDTLIADRSAARKLEEESPGVYRFEWLPAYAPELNPVEGVWNQAKYADLANAVPEDIDDLAAAVEDSLERTCCSQSLLRCFFRRGGFPL